MAKHFLGAVPCLGVSTHFGGPICVIPRVYVNISTFGRKLQEPGARQYVVRGR